MRYHWSPRLFPWRHWEDLWRNNIPGLSSTRNLSAKTIFVAIDTEPWLDHEARNVDDKEAREIGLALLNPTTVPKGLTSKPPRTLEEAYQRFPISSSCIRVRGRQRRTGENFWNGGANAIAYVDPEDVEESIVKILKTVQQSSDSNGKSLPLTLVGFDLHAELRILAYRCPRILGCFTSWVDVQELVKEDLLLPHGPSLRNTMKAYGYEPSHPTCPSRSGGHNAGNDAMRSISVLINLLFFPLQGKMWVETCKNYHANCDIKRKHRLREQMILTKSDLFFKQDPRPIEKYPFRAKVDLPGALFSRVSDPNVLCEHFLRFYPVAAGSNSTDSLGGWICLDSLKELERFVEEVHGLEDTEGRGTWTAVSQYDPKIVPVTTAVGLEYFLEDKAIVEIAEKRRIRKERKESEVNDWAYDDGLRLD